MPERYFIRVRGDVQGPFDEDRLRTLARRGRFSRSHEVSTDGLTWSRAAEFPDLFPPPPAAKFRRSGVTTSDEAYWLGDDQFASAGGTLARAIDEALDEPDGLGLEALWYYTHDMVQCGPYAFGELRLLADEGVLRPDDFVWSDGMPEWVEAARVPGLPVTSSADHHPRRRHDWPWIMLVVVAGALVVTGVVWLLRSLG